MAETDPVSAWKIHLKPRFSGIANHSGLKFSAKDAQAELPNPRFFSMASATLIKAN
jgi:hypothetical protein